MELLVISILIFASVGLLAHQFSTRKLVEELHLPDEIKDQSRAGAFDIKEILSIPAKFASRIFERSNIPLENLKRKLAMAGKPMNESQFLAFKILTTIAFPAVVFILFHPKAPILLLICLGIGFLFPDFWLKNKIKARQAAVLRNLPHIIDLLNICVGAGLDFMVAVNKVIQEFRPCAIVDEFKTMIHEIQMGASRREAMKNLSMRIGSPEMTSFIRTLLQADRMGTPIADALKMQAEEIRTARFQRGEEMALKAPIKLLAPLLLFILPVVMIIVAGPILIQFTRGGFMKF